MMKLLIALASAVILFVFVFIGLLTGALVQNNLYWDLSPGFSERLNTYLTTNIAETRQDHDYPELRLRRFEQSAGELYAALPKAVEKLGWENLQQDERSMEVIAEAVTPLWKFRDDVLMRVLPLPDGGSALYIKAVSRVGKGDLGANTNHIMRLYELLPYEGQVMVDALPEQ